MTKLAQLALLGCAAAAVLAFGGTERITFAVVQLAMFAAVFVLLLQPEPAFLHFSRRIWIVPAVLLLIPVLQTLPLVAGQEGLGTLTASRNATLEFLMLLAAGICAFFLALACARHMQSVERVVKGLVLLGVFEAFYGLVQYLTGWQQIFTYVKIYNLEEATGTYINRNHYAGLLEMLIPLSLAMAIYYSGWLRAKATNEESKLGRWMRDPHMGRAPFWLFIAVLMFLALVFSKSRMGILSTTIAVLLMAGLVQARGKRGPLGFLIPLALLAAGFSLAAWIGPEPVLKRFSQVEAEYAAGPASRTAIWRDTLGLIRQHPLLGTGLGTFPIVYTQVQTSFLTQFVNSAHNDYLEYASDLGIPGAAVLFGGILWLLARLFVFALRDARGGFETALALGCAGSIAALLMHSFTDFNLRVPANVLVFAIVLGLACAVVYPEREPASAAA